MRTDVFSNIDLSHPGSKELLEKGSVAVAWSRSTQCSRQDHGGDIYEVLQVGRRSSGAILYNYLVPISTGAASHFQHQVPGVVWTIKCEKQVSHLPIALVEELEVVDFYRVGEDEDEAGMHNET